jgi:predicted aspartyl protease
VAEGQLNVQAHGIRVTVDVGVSAPERAARYRRSLMGTLVPAQRLELLVDTGADSTTISDQAMRSLGLTPVSQTRIHTSTTTGAGVVSDVYAVELTLFPTTIQPFRIGALQVIARPFLNTGADGLLGRDVLRQLVLVYDGPRSQVKLIY